MKNRDYDFGDIPSGWLKQELYVINLMLAKATYYDAEDPIRIMMSELLHTPMVPVNTEFYMDDILSKITEIVDKFENFNLIHDLAYGEPAMQHTTMVFFVSKDKMRIYKTLIIKEMRIREGGNESEAEDKDLLVNGKLSFNIGNHEVKYDENKSLGLDPSSDYGRFLILLMSNLEKRVSYTQICDATGRDYKGEKADPEDDPSIKREMQQIKKDLLSRLQKAGVPELVLSELIVPRDGYMMHKIE
jgi:hypothetical protein